MAHSHRKIKSWGLGDHLVLLAICLMLVLATAMPAYTQSDLLKMSSRMSDFATGSRFSDIAKAGSRLVAVGERGHIVYSNDHGLSWIQAEVPVRVSLTAVNFSTAKQGWVVGHDAVVLHTADGGQTWKKLLDGFQINEIELALYQKLVKAKEAELSLANETGKEDLSYELEDLRFKLEDVQFDSEQGAWKPLLDLSFDSDGRGIVIGAFGTILSTDDGGQTWQSLSNRISNPDGYHYKNITRAGSALIIGGEVGNLYRSLDDGKSWEQLDSPSQASYFGMIANASGDIVVGSSFKGGITYSLDQGDSWRTSQAETMATLADGNYLPDGSLVIASYAGEVFKIGANSSKFAVENLGRSKFPGMTSVVATDDGHLVAVGLNGLLRIPLQ